MDDPNFGNIDVYKNDEESISFRYLIMSAYIIF